MKRSKKIFCATVKNVILFLLVTSPIYAILLYKITILHTIPFIAFRIEGELLNLILFMPFIILSSFFNTKIFKSVLICSLVLMALIIFIEMESLFFLKRYFSTDIMYSVLATNHKEMQEFATTFFSLKVIIQQVILIVLYILYCAIAIYFITKIKFTQAKNFKFTSLILLMIFPIYHLGNFHRTEKKIITQNTLYYGMIPLGLAIQYSRKNLHTIYTATTSNQNKQLVVFILGESQTRNHLGLYGYHRQTTPNLQALYDNKQISVFKNVITSEPSTATSMRNIFFKQGYETRPNINLMTAFNNAGFKNYYIENQYVKYPYKDTLMSKNNPPNSTWEYDFSLITNTIKHFSNRYTAINATYDNAVLGILNNILKNKDDKIFMLIHLQGSHFDYKDRYPKNFNKYKKPIKELLANKFLSANKVKSINSYDNSVLYTDYILNEIIKKISTMQDHKSYEISIVYISDHGDATARTGNGKHLQHSINTDKDVYEIPLIFWSNPTFKAHHPNIIRTVQTNINAPYMSDQLAFSLFHLADINIYNKSKNHPINILPKSLFSSSLNTKRIRKIGFRSGTINGIDYDKVLKPQKDLYK